MNSLPKFVTSNKLETAGGNASPIKGTVAHEVTALKQIITSLSLPYTFTNYKGFYGL